MGFVWGSFVSFAPSDSWTDLVLIFFVVVVDTNLWQGVLLSQHLAVTPVHVLRRWEVLVSGGESCCATANTYNRAKGL